MFIIDKVILDIIYSVIVITTSIITIDNTRIDLRILGIINIILLLILPFGFKKYLYVCVNIFYLFVRSYADFDLSNMSLIFILIWILNIISLINIINHIIIIIGILKFI